MYAIRSYYGKARFDYFIVDRYEAGLVLKGTEVKALRLGKANLMDVV